MTPAKALEEVLNRKPSLITALFNIWPETKDQLKTARGAATLDVHEVT